MRGFGLSDGGGQCGAIGDIGGEGLRDAASGGDCGHRLIERGAGARDQRHFRTAGRQHFGGGQPDPGRGAGDDDVAAGEIHAVSPAINSAHTFARGSSLNSGAHCACSNARASLSAIPASRLSR